MFMYEILFFFLFLFINGIIEDRHVNVINPKKRKTTAAPPAAEVPFCVLIVVVVTLRAHSS